jgi:hypothetical protein
MLGVKLTDRGPKAAAATVQYRRAVLSSIIACTSVSVSDGFACATIASARPQVENRSDLAEQVNAP